MALPGTDAVPFTLALFGPMQVLVQGHPLPRLRSRKALWLLALLALRHGRPVEREWLAATLWPDAVPDQSLSSLRSVLFDLRAALGSEAGRLCSPSRRVLSLDLGGTEVDVIAFDEAVASKSLPALARAVSLYTGPLLEGCDEEWAGQERAAREQDCLRALDGLADAALAAGDWQAAADHARRAVALDPWRDGVRRSLMEALARGGDVNAALQVYREFVAVLRDDPRATPDPETSALYARLRAEARRPAAASAPQKAPAPVVSGSLPHALTDLVGREDESLEVATRLRRSRLVTLTGPGGIGKTRLAMAVAAEIVPEYPDGVWLVALESLMEGALVAGQVASVLGLKEEPGRPPLQTLTDSLRARRLLLVLDNCEHVLDASAQVAAHLLRECAGLRVLTTSREALGITGETAWAVPALAVPDPDHLPTGHTALVLVLRGYESVRLFVERAQAADQAFSLEGENAQAVAEVCARLEGIPLAIELAAARVRGMTAPQIAARLDDHLGLLKGPGRAGPLRQQTLRATLDWSYALLSVQEQILLARASVFSGGWDLDAAETVCSGRGIDAGQVLDLLSSLTDKSLVVFQARVTGGRYRLLETVRQYAAERLKAGDETPVVRGRHRDWYSALPRRSWAAEREQAVPRLEREHSNLRAALAWCEEDPQGIEPGLGLAADLAPFWSVRGFIGEGREILERMLARTGAQGSTAARAKALDNASMFSYEIGDFILAQSQGEECLKISRAPGNEAHLAGALNRLAMACCARGDYARARALREEGLGIARERGNQRLIAWSLLGIGDLDYAVGDFFSAQNHYEESLRIRRAMGEKPRIAYSLVGLALTLLQAHGDYASAEAMLEESLGIFQELEEKFGISAALLVLGRAAHVRRAPDAAQDFFVRALLLYQETTNLAGVAQSLSWLAAVSVAQAMPGRAARLWGAAEGQNEKMGMLLPPCEQAEYDRQVAQAQEALGADTFAAAWEEGRALTWQQAVAYALETLKRSSLG